MAVVALGRVWLRGSKTCVDVVTVGVCGVGGGSREGCECVWVWWRRCRYNGVTVRLIYVISFRDIDGIIYFHREDQWRRASGYSREPDGLHGSDVTVARRHFSSLIYKTT